uniref:Cell division protein FtsK n=1 Tax=Rhabditophanes sp. KR3021 TaxID=114890 RepID=A0AC35UI53_9BILA
MYYTADSLSAFSISGLTIFLLVIIEAFIGVVALLASIVIFYFFAFVNNYVSVLTKLNKFNVFIFGLVRILLR